MKLHSSLLAEKARGRSSIFFGAGRMTVLVLLRKPLSVASGQRLTRVFLGWQAAAKWAEINAKWAGIPLVTLLTEAKRKLSVYTFMQHPLKSAEHKGNQHLPVITVLYGSWRPQVGLLGYIVLQKKKIIITAGLNKQKIWLCWCSPVQQAWENKSDYKQHNFQICRKAGQNCTKLIWWKMATWYSVC